MLPPRLQELKKVLQQQSTTADQYQLLAELEILNASPEVERLLQEKYPSHEGTRRLTPTSAHCPCCGRPL